MSFVGFLNLYWSAGDYRETYLTWAGKKPESVFIKAKLQQYPVSSALPAKSTSTLTSTTDNFGYGLQAANSGGMQAFRY
jgi:hypothetical protein